MSSFETRRASIRRQMQTMSDAASSRSNGSPARRRGSKSPKPLRGTRNPGVSQLNMDSARRFLYEDEEDINATPKAANHKTVEDDPHSFFETAADNDQSQNLWLNFRPGGQSEAIGKSSRGRNGDGIFRYSDTGKHSSDPDFSYHPSMMTSLYISFRKSIADFALRTDSYRFGIRSRYETVMADGRGKKCFLGLFVFLAVLIPSVIVLTKDGTISSNSGHSMTPSERYETISSRIEESGLSLVEDLVTEGRAQFQALEWISNGDPAQLDVDDQFLLQRYSLAVFYYSTHGEYIYRTEVVDANNFTNVRNTTTGRGDGDEEDEPVADEERVDENKSDDASELEIPEDGSEGDDFATQASWMNEDGWLSARGICSWYGVACHHRPQTSVRDTVYDGNNGLILLNMTQNNVRGRVPRELFLANQDMRWFSLESNGFFDSLPSEIGLLAELRYLSVANNFLTGTVPDEIAKLTDLERLYLEGNYMEGNIPDSMGGLSNLKSLSAYNNYLTGVIPDLSSLQNLTSLYLDTNYLSGNIPSSMGSLGKLVDLRLRQNNLGGSIPSSLSDLTSLEILYVDRNELTGTIPSELGLLGKRLEELHLYANKLTGNIPTDLASLRSVVALYVDNNMLTGPIPTEFGTMNDIETLYLQRNRITGPIPTEIGGMSNLRNFRAYSNGLMGPIPSQIAKAWKLENLFLQDNLLRGTLPTAVAELTRLQKFRLYWNLISGEVPGTVCDLMDVRLMEFKVDCAGQDPKLACSCCTHCYA